MNKWFPYRHGGYAKHPCVQLTRLQRLAVRPIRPWRSIGPTENPSTRQICSQRVMVKPSQSPQFQLPKGRVFTRWFVLG